MRLGNLVRASAASLVAALVMSPLWAASMRATGPAQPLPEQGAKSLAHSLAEICNTGSGTLMPLVASDQPAGSLMSAVVVEVPTDRAAKIPPIDDLTFVALASAQGHEEVQAAHHAQLQLKDSELRRLAATLAQQRGDANARLARLAAAKRWPLREPERPESPPAGTTSWDFDAKWTAQMIQAQERALALHRAQAHGGEDADLRRYARDVLPDIEHRLAELRRLQK